MEETERMISIEKLNKGLDTSNSYRDEVEILWVVCGQMENILHRTLSSEMLVERR